MNQAIHIFLKDARRLRLHIAALMLAIAWFALLDIREPLIVATGLGNLIIEAIVGAAVWFLIARAVHEESLPGENEFWLTRPYRRGSLIAAKILMVICIVTAPLFVADCIIVAAQSLPVAPNLGGLILRQIVIAAWLILPPFAIASVTRNIADDVMVWIVALGISATWFPNITLPTFNNFSERYAILIAVALLLIVLGRQYSRRSSNVSRALIAAAMLLPALPFPASIALALQSPGTDPAVSGISIAAHPERITEHVVSGNVQCVNIPVSLQGLQAGWRLEAEEETDTFESNSGASISARRFGNGRMSGSESTISACANPASLGAAGIYSPLTVRTSLIIAVYAQLQPVHIAAALKPFAVPDIGICRFQEVFNDKQYELFCKSPVQAPHDGTVAIGAEGASSGLRDLGYPWTPMNLLPGMSPVYKWVTLPLNSQIRDALENHGELIFRPERRIAFLRRELTMHDIHF